MARRAAALIALAALALGACGGDEEPDGPDYRLVTPPRYAGADPIAVPTPGVERTMTAKDARRLRPVIDGWSAAVREGQNATAARYFALPAIIAQPSTGPIEVRTRPIAERFNAVFPCGAKLLGTRAEGRYVVGTFELVRSPGRPCSTPNAKVQVGFVFGDEERPRRFTEWWRVAETPGAEVGPPRRPAAPIAGPRSFG